MPVSDCNLGSWSSSSNESEHEDEEKGLDEESGMSYTASTIQLLTQGLTFVDPAPRESL